MAEQNIIDGETAQLLFDEFCDNWRIKNDVSKFSADDKSAFELARERMIDAYQSGNLENDPEDKRTLKYRFYYPDDLGVTEIKIRRPRGATFMETDSGKKDAGMTKMFYMLGEMTGKPVSFFSRVDGVDVKVITSICTLFFGS